MAAGTNNPTQRESWLGNELKVSPQSRGTVSKPWSLKLYLQARRLWKSGEQLVPSILVSEEGIRRRPYELARLRKMPVAIEMVRRIDELFAIEREINGLTPMQRLAVRQARSKPLVEDLERWMCDERSKLSAKNPLAKRCHICSIAGKHSRASSTTHLHL